MSCCQQNVYNDPVLHFHSLFFVPRGQYVIFGACDLISIFMFPYARLFNTTVYKLPKAILYKNTCRVPNSKEIQLVS